MTNFNVPTKKFLKTIKLFFDKLEGVGFVPILCRNGAL
jgi:hypothetical protein